MPFGDEATEFTRQLVDHKVVRIKLLRKDQYNRAVAKVTTKGFLPFTKKDVTLQLAERGLATLYTGGGAEYDVSYYTHCCLKWLSRGELDNMFTHPLAILRSLLFL